jgi:hypothetical protein
MAARSRLMATCVGLIVMLGLAVSAEAGSRKATRAGNVAHRGGYSYSPEDTVNTYGDSRTKYGGATSLRDPMLDRQTEGGPFDHGFFFDSGVAPRGGNSPYMN